MTKTSIVMPRFRQGDEYPATQNEDVVSSVHASEVTLRYKAIIVGDV